jgi:protein farnesyltransferase subunit beta
MEIAQYSAAQLFVCFEGEGSRAQDETQQQEPAAGGSSSSGAAAAAGAQGQGRGRPAALFDTDALQVWVLKGCQQQLKGGLRDKPGKPPDYYHTCYCLSGLSAAQHAEGGGGVLGAAGNQLRKASPLLNVLEEKVEAAAVYFGSLPRI